MKFTNFALILALFFIVQTETISCKADGAPQKSEPPLVVAVLDPLSIDLACDCVAGFAQRDYRVLSAYLEKRLQRPVELVFAGSVASALEKTSQKRVDVVIGKDSVVCHGLYNQKLIGKRIAWLTDRHGKTTFTGLIVVAADDPVERVADLKKHRIVFGPPECEEKHTAAIQLLEKESIPIPKKPETVESCTIAALEIVDNESETPVAAVISDYALTLIEGCQTIEKGTLRIIGKTEEVPFISVFVTDSLGGDTLKVLFEALVTFSQNPEYCKTLESKDGFVPLSAILDELPWPTIPENRPTRKHGDQKTTSTWPQWRGVDRTASDISLPDRLSDEPHILWKKELEGDGISGPVSDGKVVIVADRDTLDTSDIFRCLDFETGAELWTLRYAAPSDFDYGNAPRATPLLAGDRLFTLGASGHLHAVDLASGRVVWKMNLVSRFDGILPLWGVSGSPLLIDETVENGKLTSGKLIVQPGAVEAGLVALDALNGNVIWTSSPGRPAAYASPLITSFSGRRQIVAYDEKSLGGWDPETGERLWELLPRRSGDFNVPIPIPLDAGSLFIVTENNHGRIHRFDEKGQIIAEPVAVQDEIGHDSNTPVVSDDRIYAADWALVCMDVNGLDVVWTLDDDDLGDFATLIVGRSRLLVTTHSGSILLVDLEASPGTIVSRCRLFDDDVVLSHPAVVDNKLLLRSSSEIFSIAFFD